MKLIKTHVNLQSVRDVKWKNMVQVWTYRDNLTFSLYLKAQMNVLSIFLAKGKINISEGKQTF